MVELIPDILFFYGPELPEHEVDKQESQVDQGTCYKVQEEDVRPEVLILVVHKLRDIGEVLRVSRS